MVLQVVLLAAVSLELVSLELALLVASLMQVQVARMVLPLRRLTKSHLCI
jgi:hypothetical protein